MPQFLLSVAAGVAATLSAALLILAGNWIRNERLERRLREAFAVKSAGQSTSGFEITLTNSTWVPVTVRQVVVYFHYPNLSAVLTFTDFEPY